MFAYSILFIGLHAKCIRYNFQLEEPPILISILQTDCKVWSLHPQLDLDEQWFKLVDWIFTSNIRSQLPNFTLNVPCLLSIKCFGFCAVTNGESITKIPTPIRDSATCKWWLTISKAVVSFQTNGSWRKSCCYYWITVTITESIPTQVSLAVFSSNTYGNSRRSFFGSLQCIA